MYPPPAAEIHWVTINAIAVRAATEGADVPCIEARSRPVAMTVSSNEIAAATTAPAKIAGQDTAEVADSGALVPRRGGLRFETVRSSILLPTSVRTHSQQQDDGNRYT